MISLKLDDKAVKAAIARMSPAEVTKVLVPIVERRANDARKEAVTAFTSQGVGRGIFGRKPSGAFGLIRLAKVMPSAGGVAAKIDVSGFAKLQELGGRTKRHFIRKGKRKGKTLAFTSGGGMMFAKWVDHPGGAVRKYPAVIPAAERAGAKILEDMRAKLAAMWTSKAA